MKKIITIITIIFSVSMYSQNFVEYRKQKELKTQLTLMQDLKLATMSDDYGNKPFTTDIIIKVKQKWDSQVFVGLSFEYANLQKNYYRFSQLLVMILS